MQPQPIQHTLQALQTAPTATHDLHPLVSQHPWDYVVYHPALEPLPREVKRWVSDVLHGQPRRWLSLLGPSGIGKTHLLTQAYRLLQHANDTGQWKTRQNLGHGWGLHGHEIAHLTPADLEDWRAPRDYARHALIYLEDIGAGAFGERGSGSVAKSRIIELLQLRTNKWTLLDANLYRRDIAHHLDPRIASRLKRDHSTCLEIPADVPDFWG